MTPSSTPGPSGDPMPWSDGDPRGSSDATRPIPPVSRHPGAAPPGGPAPRPSFPAPGGAADGTGEHWAWYDEDAQHTTPLPAVTAQRPVPEDPDPRTDPTPSVPAAGYAGGHAVPVPAAAAPGVPDAPGTRYAQQREEFGGLQLVPGFFGWLSTLALTWLLLALAGLGAAALGLRLGDGVGGVVDELAAGSPTAWTGAAALGAVELLAFLGGGYAAGRMARFSGARQGVSVWLWSLLGRSVATVAGLVWADTVGLAPVGVSAQALIGDLLVPGLLAVAVVLAVDLLGAVLGGLWGVRYHRRVDRWADTDR
ncbi:MAG: hypothetical protein ACOC84_07735 [Actinomycetota bacterium]